jgi:hypothetical protein
MPDIGDIMDVNIEDLSLEQQQQLKDAADQFQQKCHSKRTGVASHTSKMTCLGFYCQERVTLRLSRRGRNACKRFEMPQMTY